MGTIHGGFDPPLRLVWLIGTAGVFGPAAGAAAQQTTVFHGAELPYEVIDGWALHAGDIIPGTAEEAAAQVLRGPRNSGDVPPIRRLAPYPREVLWPGGIVPYVIDDDVAHPEWIREAIAIWNRETVVRLVERTAHRDYLRFAVGAGCFGVFGQSYDGGERFMPVKPRGCPVAITLHEIDHAIGMWHEQAGGELRPRSKPLGGRPSQRSRNGVGGAATAPAYA